jgi:hypothetical protein
MKERNMNPPEEEKIKCDCNDRACKRIGYEGEVANHIDECSCADCHRALGKISWQKGRGA